jgi:hypothetical protein
MGKAVDHVTARALVEAGIYLDLKTSRCLVTRSRRRPTTLSDHYTGSEERAPPSRSRSGYC